jgi:5-oxoprolinase (ATP-hydrolysing) subunit A
MVKRKDLGLNMDCGEELPGKFAKVDEFLMPALTYCNIACGFHAGGIETMHHTVDLALQHNVKIGAHPSFDDKVNFGRFYMDLPFDKLVELIKIQVEQLQNVVSQKQNGNLYHIKAHGALYNAAMKNEKEALAIIKAVKDINKDYIIFCMHNSTLANLAQQEGLTIMDETFADRNYKNAQTLVPRSEENAMIDEAEAIIAQIKLLKTNKITTVDGLTYDLISDTICLHGDHPLIFETGERLKDMIF